ncbi:MAG: helix-turn-helix transcriptional regulator [Myxococcaceae bacterium]
MERELRRALAQNLIRLRKERGWTQEHLAEDADLIPTHVQKLEYGVSNATLKTIAALAAAFGVQPIELFRLRSAGAATPKRASRSP